ncbi:tRNA A64-2'-O-ribosylphosphate transferase [Tilletia horrida]|uniref:tRNA A64-2'-O-ribosylphosphate transferase n=1 Tax=Tilletia horrida TaxID=155126 RepID=A0AAN6GFK3_9BASI|nr:tRNA A64-2'-O-ribosylphosphate transferase [Tilletia horrida]
MEFHSEVRELQKEVDRELRKREKDLFNRLWSIKHDADFVSSVAERLQSFPVIANLRCGAWYADPRKAKGSCYFKSTDGHSGRWGFSLKRHNLDLVDLISRNGGCIIVDSTRSGKTMPDALSKTIPTWCAVLNRASALKYGSPSGGTLDGLVTPEELVSRSEHAQIEARIDAWAHALLDSDLAAPILSAPLRPYFVTTSTDLSELAADLAQLGTSSQRHCLPVILLSASRSRSQAPSTLIPDRRWDDISPDYPPFDYVQGSGDDHENWALGLTPSLFWAASNHERILRANRGADIEGVVVDIVAQAQGKHWADIGIPAEANAREMQVGATGVFLGVAPRPDDVPHLERWQADVLERFALVINCDGQGTAEAAIALLREGQAHVVNLGLKQGKVGAGPFGHHLSSILNALICRLLKLRAGTSSEGMPRVLLCDTTGRDLAPSLAVALLAACFGPGQRFLPSDDERWTHQAQLDKDQVRRRLQWVMTATPGSGSGSGSASASAGPARVFLNRVNAEVLAAGRRPDYSSSLK